MSSLRLKRELLLYIDNLNLKKFTYFLVLLHELEQLVLLLLVLFFWLMSSLRLKLVEKRIIIIYPGKRKTLFQNAFLNSNKNGKKTTKNDFLGLKKRVFAVIKRIRKRFQINIEITTFIFGLWSDAHNFINLQ